MARKVNFKNVNIISDLTVDFQVKIFKIQDSKDFIVHLKHHIKNGNCSSVTQ